MHESVLEARNGKQAIEVAAGSCYLRKRDACINERRIDLSLGRRLRSATRVKFARVVVVVALEKSIVRPLV